MILPLIYSLLCLFIIQKGNFFTMEGVKKKHLHLIFILKLLSGFGMALLYTYYYTDRSTADTFKFFDDSKIMYDAWKQNPMHLVQMLTGIHSDATYLQPYYDTMHNWWNKYAIYNDNRTQIRVNCLLRFISFGNYYVHSVIFTFLSFIGMTGLLKVFSRELKSGQGLLILIVYLLPSLLFWCSGLLKESLIMFSLGMTIYFFISFLSSEKKKIISLTGFILSFLFLLIIKFHIPVLLIPSLLAYLWCFHFPNYPFLKFSMVNIFFMVFLFTIQAFFPSYNFMASASAKQQEFVSFAEQTKAGSTIPLTPLKPEAGSFIKNIPEALSHVLFRPVIGESKAPLILLASAENFLILIIILLSVFSFVMSKKKFSGSSLFYLSLFYSLLLFILIGWTTPVMGAIVRYKTHALCFFLFVFISIMDTTILKEKFPVLRKLKFLFP